MSRNLTIYLTASALGFYLVWAFFAPIFAPMLPQDPNACVAWYSPYGETEACADYINDSEAFKAMHNYDMKFRNVLLLGGLVGLLALVNFSYFRLSGILEKRDGEGGVYGNQSDLWNAILFAIEVGVGVVVFNNLILYYLIDMDHAWYPEIFTNSEFARAAFSYYYRMYN